MHVACHAYRADAATYKACVIGGGAATCHPPANAFTFRAGSLKHHVNAVAKQSKHGEETVLRHRAFAVVLLSFVLLLDTNAKLHAPVEEGWTYIQAM